MTWSYYGNMDPVLDIIGKNAHPPVKTDRQAVAWLVAALKRAQRISGGWSGGEQKPEAGDFEAAARAVGINAARLRRLLPLAGIQREREVVRYTYSHYTFLPEFY
jgi:hypothetical protein